MLIRQKPQESMSEPSNSFRQARLTKHWESSRGKVLPVSYPLNFRLTHVWLWKKLHLNCNQTSQCWVEVEKVNLFSLDFWLQKGTSYAKPWFPWTLRGALGFNSLLPTGTPKCICQS